jgi:hypothetical protein
MAAVCLAGLAMLGCTGSSQSGGTAGGDPGEESCIATMSFIQKDAYRTTAGLTNLWPPHTSTQLDVMCGGVRVAGGMHENHGPKPDELDDNGNPILKRVASLAADGTRMELEAVAEAYRSCECTTSFISLDSFEDESVEQLLAALESYITANLSCTGAAPAELLAALLEQGEINTVLAELPNCSWNSGASWVGAFDDALSSIDAQAQHVSNNDALLQAALLQTYAANGSAVACDGLGALCVDPAWYYEP